MLKFLANLSILVGILSYSAVTMAEERVEDPMMEEVLVGEPLETIPFATAEDLDVEWDTFRRSLVPPLDHLTMDTKAYCDEKAGITEAYSAGRDPSWGEWQRFDRCQRSINRQQGIGVYKRFGLRYHN